MSKASEALLRIKRAGVRAAEELRRKREQETPEERKKREEAEEIRRHTRHIGVRG